MTHHELWHTSTVRHKGMETCQAINAKQPLPPASNLLSVGLDLWTRASAGQRRSSHIDCSQHSRCHSKCALQGDESLPEATAHQPLPPAKDRPRAEKASQGKRQAPPNLEAPQPALLPDTLLQQVRPSNFLRVVPLFIYKLQMLKSSQLSFLPDICDIKASIALLKTARSFARQDRLWWLICQWYKALKAAWMLGYMQAMDRILLLIRAEAVPVLTTLSANGADTIAGIAGKASAGRDALQLEALSCLRCSLL